MIKAGKIGIDICSEKPIASTFQDGLDILQIFEESDTNLSLGLQNRLNLKIRLIKK